MNEDRALSTPESPKHGILYMRSRCQKCLNEIGSVAICNWTSPLDSYHAHKNSTVIAVGLQKDILLK